MDAQFFNPLCSSMGSISHINWRAAGLVIYPVLVRSVDALLLSHFSWSLLLWVNSNFEFDVVCIHDVVIKVINGFGCISVLETIFVVPTLKHFQKCPSCFFHHVAGWNSLWPFLAPYQAKGSSMVNSLSFELQLCWLAIFSFCLTSFCWSAIIN